MTWGESSAHATHTIDGRTIHARSPVRAAVLALVTVSVYGFWWWWDLNRQLRDMGRPARPARALGLVTLGWLIVAPAVMAGWFWLAVALSLVPAAMSILSVRETAAMVSDAQRATGVRRVVSVPVALGLAGTALAGLIAWFAVTAGAGDEDGMALGVLWPLVAMGLVAYLQAGFNQILGD